MASKKSKAKFKFKNIILGIVVVVLVAFVALLAYSAYLFQSSPQEEEGFFVCNDDNTDCRLSQHVHADIALTVCGNEIVFPREKGRTDEMHTHKEKNYMHWHSPVRVDPVTHVVIPEDRYRLTLQSFIDQMEFVFPDSCPDNPNPSITVDVNEVENEEGLEYLWVDGDDVVITFE